VSGAAEKLRLARRFVAPRAPLRSDSRGVGNREGVGDVGDGHADAPPVNRP